MGTRRRPALRPRRIPRLALWAACALGVLTAAACAPLAALAQPAHDAGRLLDGRRDGESAALATVPVDGGRDGGEQAIPDAGPIPPPDAGVAAVSAPRREAGSGDTATGVVVWTVLGLVFLVTLVWLASHPAVRRIEELFGVETVLTAGFAFVALGAAARHPAVGVLDDAVLEELTPILHFALGWLGFLIGFRLDVRKLDGLAPGTARSIGIESAAPFAVVALAGALVFLAFGEVYDARFVRHALALGAAGAISVAFVSKGADSRHEDHGSVPPSERTASLGEIAGIVVLAVIGAFFRPGDVEWRWDLPGTVWLFLMLGMGGGLGLLVYVMAREKATTAEFLAIVLGSVALGAGMAGYLFLSPVVVCFFAGAVVASLPLENRDRVGRMLELLERPMYYVLLTFAGALWVLDDPRGWILVPVFVASRAVGTYLGKRALSRAIIAGTVMADTSPYIVRPVRAVSIAIVVSLQVMYGGLAISWIVTAVLGGAIVTEVLVQILQRRRRAREGAAVA